MQRMRCLRFRNTFLHATQHLQCVLLRAEPLDRQPACRMVTLRRRWAAVLSYLCQYAMSKLAQVAAARLNRLQLCFLLLVRWQTCVRQHVAMWTPQLHCCAAITLLWLLLRFVCAIPEQVAELPTKRVVMLHVQLGIYVR